MHTANYNITSRLSLIFPLVNWIGFIVVSVGISFTCAQAQYSDVTSTVFPGGQGLSDADVAWGDINGDGTPELFMLGKQNNITAVTQLYYKNGASYVSANINFPKLYDGAIAFGDYNNDGNIDLAISGRDINTNTAVTQVYQSTGGFPNAYGAIAPQSLMGVADGSLAWADYDNDGDLDLLVTGNTASNISPSVNVKLYENDNGTFLEDIGASNLLGVKNGQVKWGDYDNDGLQDIFMVGDDEGNAPKLRLYKNFGGSSFQIITVTDFTTNRVRGGSIALADYDHDDDLDLLIAGNKNSSGANLITTILENQGPNQGTSQFLATSINFTGIQNGEAIWGDYDSDGYADVLLAGSDGSNPVMRLYRNNQNGSFSNTTPSAFNVGLEFDAAIAFGDYDEDDRLDILATGGINSSVAVQRIYRNTSTGTNNASPQPTGLSATPSGNSVLFNWNDAGPGLSYNLIIGTAGTSDEYDPAMADITGATSGTAGRRFVFQTGNIQDNTWTISNIPGINTPTTLFASVQSIGADYEGSVFSSQVNFIYTPPSSGPQIFKDTTTSMFTGAPPTGVRRSDVEWGDFDRDGDLDLLTSGNTSVSAGSGYFRVWRNNGNGSFTQFSTPITTSVENVDAAWGDYDADGDLDLVICGRFSGSTVETQFWEFTGAGFTLNSTPTSVTDVENGSVDWGDVDNDGDLDLLITGKPLAGGPVSHIYLNKGNSGALTTDFELHQAFEGVSNGDAAFADFDKDGWIDLVLTGSNGQASPASFIHKNNGDGTFESTNFSGAVAVLDNITNSSVAWGDLDNDGYTDLVMTGTTNGGGRLTKVYRYLGQVNFFTTLANINQAFTQVGNGDVALGDYDDDGSLDIVVTGDDINGIARTNLYQNNGSGVFVDNVIGTGDLDDVRDGSSLAWGDFDEDGKLDLVLAGRLNASSSSILKLYRNKDLTYPNTVPVAPTLNPAVQSGFDVTLSWNPPAPTPSNTGWTYVLYLDRAGGSSFGDVRSPMSAYTGGFRRIVHPGEAWGANSITFRNLPQGNYIWSVQSVDQDYEGSPFAAAGAFDYIEPTFVDDNPFPSSPPIGPPVGLSNASLAWGDYDSDGILDLVACGTDAAGNPSTTLYLYDNNQYGIDVSSSGNIVDVENGSVDWGDMDNDGDLDLLIAGHDGTNDISRVYINLNGAFSSLAGNIINLTGVSNSTAKWLDYNMDGYSDILITGETGGNEDIKLYINQKDGTFSTTTPAIQAVSHGDIAVGDFDNNGYPDVAISGENNGNAFAGLYVNNQGQSFSLSGAAFISLTDCSLDFGDYNADGFLDLAVAGRRTVNNARVSRVYTNNKTGGFNASFMTLNGVDEGSIDWGDYDNDGYKDLLLTGNNGSGRVIELYHYNSGTSQLDLVTSGTSGMSALDTGSDAAWGDYDNDGKLDLALAGTAASGKVIHIFRNIDPQPVSGPPSAPTALDFQISGYEVLLHWNAPASGVAHPKGLSYNVYLGTGSSGTPTDKKDPEALLSNGKRKLVKIGQVNDTTVFRIRNLPAGNYCWGVQAVDADFEGSPFAHASAVSKCFTYEPPAFVNASVAVLGGSVSGLDQGDLAWGDYDNDGDLDLLAIGQQSGSVNATRLYRNDGGNSFTAVSDPFPDVQGAAAAWGDIDGDNDQDVIITGRTAGGSGAPVSRIFRNNNGSFIALQNLPGVESGSVVWGDYDNDGDLDLLLMGTNSGGQAIADIYENTGFNSGSFAAVSAGFEAATNGVASWVDYDQDGFLDVFLTGNGSSGRILRFYHNAGANTFNLVGIGSNIPASTNASADWGDFDNNGYPDLALMGSTSSGLNSRIYLNNNGSGFTLGNQLIGMQNGDIQWGDYDNDGWSDIVISGSTSSGRETRLYRNNAGTLVYLDIASAPLTGADNGSAVSWGDYNNDKKLDLALLGRSVTSPVTRVLQVFENVDPSSNNLIDLPRTLNHQVNGDTIVLSWFQPQNVSQSTKDGLTYNLYFGTSSQLASIASPQAFIGGSEPGLRKVVYQGNVGHRTSYRIIGIPSGSYSWSVQAIGQDFEASAFASQQTLNYSAPAFVDVTSMQFPVNTPEGFTESALDWGDYDGDGDLDLTISGIKENGKPVTLQYEQGSGTFTLDQVQSNNLLNLSAGDLAWGDIDLDQDLDLLIMGLDSLGNAISQIYLNNGSGNLTLNPALSDDIIDVSDGSAAWGDYDNDGDLDLAISGDRNGTPLSVVYKNENGQLIPDPDISITQLSDGDLAWGDYDGDGYLDLLHTGRNGNQLLSRIYRNNGVIGGFTDINASLTGVFQSSVSWGDYDTDGKLDVLLAGESSTSQVAPIAEVYHYESGSFVKRFDLNPGVKTGDAVWLDYSDDGRPDIIITGKHGANQGDRSTFVYLNTNGTAFQEDAATGQYLAGPDNGSSLAIGDFNNDGKADLAISGQVANVFPRKTFRLYANASQTTNLKPDPPTGLSATPSADSVIISWTPPSGYPANRVNGLSYNLIITQTPGGANQTASMADQGTGFRKVVGIGNIYSRNSWSIRNLPAGSFTCRIQSIGPDFEGSAFSSAINFNFQPPAFVNMNSVAFRPPLTTGLSDSDLEWGDYDNDGDLDLVVNGSTNGTNENTFLYENIAGGYFELNASASTTLTDVRNGQLSWADVNGDGWLDLVVTGSGSTGRVGRIFMNDGQKNFTLLSTPALAPAESSSVAWGDFDQDGGYDLLLSGNSLGMNVSQLLRNGKDGTFTSAGNFFSSFNRSGTG